jgi:Domain of unknown function (DUF4378)/IQ calmodulin-binding motif
MNRNQAKESNRSPSVTPPNLNTKPNAGCKKKPPVHKHRPQDVTNNQKNSQTIKVPTPKKKLNKNRTNSITPKTLKHNIYERIYHNSNLSDTDVSSKYIAELNHLSSKINKSLINRFELTQKVKDPRKNSGTVIDKIIKKSLNKAKQRKLSQEKENKETELKKEIRKQELYIQNKQIRDQNCMSFKKKKSKNKNKSRWDSQIPVSINTGKIRSESSSKVRNHTGSLLIDSDARNKRSISTGDYYLPVPERKSDPYILDYMDYKNKKRKESDDMENLKKKAEEISKATRLRNLDKFTKAYNIKSPRITPIYIEISSENSDSDKNEESLVKRNISFIEERNCDDSSDEDLIDLNNKFLEGYEYDDKDDGRNQLIGEYNDDNQSLEDLQTKAAMVIQRHFRMYLIRRLLNKNKSFTLSHGKSFKVCPVKNKKLSIENTSQAFWTPSKRKLNVVTSREKKFLIKPLKKFNLCIDNLSKNHLEIQSGHRKLDLSICSQPKTHIKPQKNIVEAVDILKSQLYDQISWNTAQIYIIEQLKLHELNLYSDQVSILNDKIQEKINKKYNSLLQTLKSSIESSYIDIIEDLPLDQYAHFESKKHQKQEMLYKKLLEAQEDSPRKDLGLTLGLGSKENINGGMEDFSDLSSEDREPRIGITHSRSLSQLHGDAVQGKYTSSQSKESTKTVKFLDIEDTIEVQNIELTPDQLIESIPKKALPALPNLPMLHLDFMQQDLIYSEPRILTSIEFIKDYVKNILTCLDLNNVILELSRPIKKNIHDELFKLHDKVVGTPCETKIYDFPMVFDSLRLLDHDSDGSGLESTIRLINRADKIHKKLILDVLNYFLNQLRPYGTRGEPFPWSRKERVVGFKLEIPKIISEVCKNFEIYCGFQVGRIFNEEIITSNGGIDDSLIERLREEKLEKLVLFEAIQEEEEWIDYEFEETQIKFDISDMILDDLTEEFIKIMDGI